MKPNTVKILVAAQTPPPYGGMPIMIQRMLDSELAGIEFIHVRMALSSNVNQIGRFRFSKILHMLATICRIHYRRWADGVRILYYVPAGPDRRPMYRDLLVLLLTRWLFDKTIFHYHSAGVSELYDQIPAWQQWLYRRAYFGADAAIRLSKLNPEDGRLLLAKRDYVIPYGIDDPCPEPIHARSTGAASATDPLRILFVSILYESKGLMVLVEACGKLAALGVPFQLDVVGQWQTEEFAARVHKRIDELNVKDRVHFHGQVIGQKKFAHYRRADVFCFPTYFNCESFGVVLLEATGCGLPVVASRWRGIPSVVDDNRTGFLVEPHDSEAMADRLKCLAESPDLRLKMGRAGRRKFEQEYTISRHLEQLRSVFLEVGAYQSDTAREIPNALATT